jgi:ParB-like chromosome segregation protein Spo0J
MPEITDHPINNIKWVGVETLKANSYNPNVVLNQEMKLLAFSLIKNGWIQPILATHNGEIIDGYHRFWLSCNNPEVRNLTAGLVPVAFLNLSEPERMLLTVRINRAKGSHIAVKMHDLIETLVKDYGMSIDTICKEIGANKDEIELLLMENVFKKFDTKNYKYSKAWIPGFKRKEKA